MPPNVNCSRCIWLTGKPGAERVWPHCKKCGEHHSKDVTCGVHEMHTDLPPRTLGRSA